MLALAAAAAIAAGTFFLMPSQPEDSLSQAQIQQIVQNFEGIVAEFPAVDLSNPEEKAKAIESLDLPQAQSQEIIQAAERNEFKLCWITVWDNMDEDGDVVSVSANGFTRTVPILHNPVTLAFPLTPGGSIAITGIRDGQGGITAGAQTQAGAIQFPPLNEGQTVHLRVR